MNRAMLIVMLLLSTVTPAAMIGLADWLRAPDATVGGPEAAERDPVWDATVRMYVREGRARLGDPDQHRRGCELLGQAARVGSSEAQRLMARHCGD
jgi:hypothetical protein